jgi:hypothetical protein
VVGPRGLRGREVQMISSGTEWTDDGTVDLLSDLW